VFDPSCYGEEEFGPEKDVQSKPSRKKREKKKKETKAIIGQRSLRMIIDSRGTRKS